MRSKYIVATALLFSGTLVAGQGSLTDSASAPTGITPAQLQGAADVQSYVESLETQAAFSSVASALTALGSSQLDQLYGALANPTGVSAAVSDLPSGVQSYFISVESEASEIAFGAAASSGITGVGGSTTPTATSSGTTAVGGSPGSGSATSAATVASTPTTHNAASQPTAAMMAAGAAAAGILGLAALL